MLDQQLLSTHHAKLNGYQDDLDETYMQSALRQPEAF